MSGTIHTLGWKCPFSFSYGILPASGCRLTCRESTTFTIASIGLVLGRFVCPHFRLCFWGTVDYHCFVAAKVQRLNHIEILQSYNSLSSSIFGIHCLGAPGSPVCSSQIGASPPPLQELCPTPARVTTKWKDHATWSGPVPWQALQNAVLGSWRDSKKF